MPSRTNKRASGKLLDKAYNVAKKLRKEGIINSKPDTIKTIAQRPDCASEEIGNHLCFLII